MEELETDIRMKENQVAENEAQIRDLRKEVDCWTNKVTDLQDDALEKNKKMKNLRQI